MTYLGHGPSLENVDPVEVREVVGTVPTGLCVVLTWKTGLKVGVKSSTVGYGALAALGHIGED